MRCANCGGYRIQWSAPLDKREAPLPVCLDCYGLSMTDRPPDGELLVEIRDSLREIQKTLTMLEARIP